MTSKVRIYLAGPLGFSEAGRHFYNAVLIPFVRKLGYEVLDPWTLTDATRLRKVGAMAYGPAKREAWRKLDLEMGATNRAAIDASQGVVAVLDGTDVDSGTAGDRLRLCARQAHRRLPGRLPPECRQRGGHREPPGRVLHPGERGDDRRPLRGSRTGAPVPGTATSGRSSRLGWPAWGRTASRRDAESNAESKMMVDNHEAARSVSAKEGRSRMSAGLGMRKSGGWMVALVLVAAMGCTAPMRPRLRRLPRRHLNLSRARLQPRAPRPRRRRLTIS